MRDHLDEFGDGTIAVVTFAEPSHLADYRTHQDVDFVLLTDVDRALYRILGAVRGTRRQVWSTDTLRMYAGLISSGRRLRRPTEDTRQLGADVVIGRDGRIRYIALPPTPGGRPPISDLIAALD